ncbi:collagen alpha-2(IV) chain-like isoform X2 [Saccostrea echinata]|uniref:collagen alpha-2(IV) chain-like isoform X2 n=1 Tax=Saccostrea echinata TaxID=191078 RepID=UPI002A82B9AD|nr:collagen alpha-2(IV) chain-like isoform X2 [Saccostrea echinata]
MDLVQKVIRVILDKGVLVGRLEFQEVTGPKGSMGDQVRNPPKGEKEEVGLPGLKGPKGSITTLPGNKLDEILMGEKGYQGDPSEGGRPGRPGFNGMSGDPGFPGLPGDKGPFGMPGMQEMRECNDGGIILTLYLPLFLWRF